MKREILVIAQELGYSKVDRLRDADNISDQALLDILKTSIVEPYAILFFPGKCFQITPFGMSLSLLLSMNQQTDNYLIAFPELDEKFLRQAFTGFELVVYKICHIALESQRTDYHWETEKTRARFRRLQPLLALPDWNSYFELFDEIFFVRDAFAHSFIPLVDIRYRQVRLDDCFGESFVGHTRDAAATYGARIFLNDLRTLFDPVMNLFKQYQLKQIDSSKLFKLCDRLLMARTLSPGA